MPAAPRIPRILPAHDAVARHQAFSGALPASQFLRTSELMPDSQVKVDVLFLPDRPNAGRITGQLTAQLQQICQRCLEVFPYALHAAIDWTLINRVEDEARVADDRDPLLLDEDGNLLLHEAIEDELLMNLPLAPHCENPECLKAYHAGHARNPNLGDNRELRVSQPNPFLALKDQIKH